MAKCTGKKKNGEDCGMRAGAGGVCVNHRPKPAAAATPATPQTPPAAAEQRALMPGETADQVKPKPRRAARGQASTTAPAKEEEGGGLIAGALAGLGAVAAIAWVLFSPKKPAAAAAPGAP